MTHLPHQTQVALTHSVTGVPPHHLSEAVCGA